MDCLMSAEFAGKLLAKRRTSFTTIPEILTLINQKIIRGCQEGNRCITLHMYDYPQLVSLLLHRGCLTSTGCDLVTVLIKKHYKCECGKTYIHIMW